jgi:hypothetical protein
MESRLNQVGDQGGVHVRIHYALGKKGPIKGAAINQNFIP